MYHNQGVKGQRSRLPMTPYYLKGGHEFHIPLDLFQSNLTALISNKLGMETACNRELFKVMRSKVKILIISRWRHRSDTLHHIPYLLKYKSYSCMSRTPTSFY